MSKFYLMASFILFIFFIPLLHSQNIVGPEAESYQNQRLINPGDINTKQQEKSVGIAPGLDSNLFHESNQSFDHFQLGDIIANAWNIAGQNSGVPEGVVSIEIPSANISSLMPESEFWMGGGDFADNIYYGASFNNFNSGLYIIDPYTGQYELFFTTDKGITGLAYDDAGKVMYASDWDGTYSNLYSVDLRFGTLDHIGIISQNIIIGIAIDNEGNLFALDLNESQLLAVDRFTAEYTVIGPLGISINFMQDINFDRQNNILYGTLMTANEVGGLYSIDTETGHATLLNNYFAQLGAFAIPYVIVEDNAPGAVDDFQIVADDTGALSADISWLNPMYTYGGEALDQLSEVILLRGNDVIYSLTDPQIGQQENFTDNLIPEPGNYVYRVYGVNAYGNGFISSMRVYVGEDVPGNPLNLNVQSSGNNAFISWDDPVDGLNQGFFDGQNLTYSIRRLPCDILVAEDFTQNSFVDTQLPSTNKYQYIVQAENHIGVGGQSTSSKILLGNENVLFFENFNDGSGTIPDSWDIIGDMQGNWYLWQSDNAGGNVPEIMFSWSPPGTGASRLASPIIDLNGFSNIRIQFKHMLHNYLTDPSPYVIGIDVSYDDGLTWTMIEEYDGVWNIIANTTQLYHVVPDNTESIRIAFRFEGNSLGVEQWWIDDVILEPVFDNHIGAINIRPSDLVRDFVPVVNKQSSFEVTLQNKGSLFQTDYTVKLVDGLGNILDQTDGAPLSMGESHTFLMNWTPWESQAGDQTIRAAVDITGAENYGNNSPTNLQVRVLPESMVKVSIGQDDDLFSSAIPLGFYVYSSLSQTIYPATDIDINSGYISGLSFTSNFFEDIIDREVKLYIGETSQYSFSNSYIPASELTQVFDGRLDFPSDINNIFIPFDEPYFYEGGNIVVFSNRVFETNYFGFTNLFYNNTGSVAQSRVTVGMEPLNPEAPPAFGNNHPIYPSISFYFDKEGKGSLAGNVNDGQFGIQGVKVELMETDHVVYTNHVGNYDFSYVLDPGIYNVRFSKPGFSILVSENVTVEELETTQLDVSLSALQHLSLQGSILDETGSPIDGAWIKLTGNNLMDYKFLSDNNGFFSSNTVYEGTYFLEIIKYGFEPYIVEQFVLDQATELGDLLLEKIIYEPSALFVDVIDQDDGNALLSWLFEEERSFRYDEGVLNNTFGFVFGNENTVMGSVFTNDARVLEIAWFNNVSSGSGTLVNIWILGLDENGLPNGQDILYQRNNVPNLNNNWNLYSLEEEVEAQEGFFVGFSYEGNFGLGMDSGQSNHWPYQTDSYFFTHNIQNGSFQPIENHQDNVGNLMIRAYGWDAGTVEGFAKEKSGPITHIGFNVFLNDLENPIYQNTTENEYLLTDLEEGLHTAGVQSVYSVSNSAIITKDFANFSNVQVTLTINNNSGDPLDGALVELINEDFAQFTYEQLSPPSGQVLFEEVSKGNYTLKVFLENHEAYLVNGLEIQDDFSYSVMLTEIIEEPFGLMVDTKGMEPGEALFRWNIHEEGFFEGFENSFPPNGWGQINADNGVGWVQLASGTAPLPGWNGGEAFPAPDGGDFMAYSTYLQSGSHFNDMWLVSPQVFVIDDFELSFFLRYYPNNFIDKFQIALSTTSATDPEAFDIIVDIIQFGFSSSTQWERYSYDLSDFAPLGTPVYIGFREFVEDNSVMGATLMLDNIFYGLKDENETTAISSLFSDSNDIKRNYLDIPLANNHREFFGFNIYLNDSIVAQNVSSNQFIFGELTEGVYQAGVQSVYSSGLSPIVYTQFEITEGFVAPEFANIQFVNMTTFAEEAELSVSVNDVNLVDAIPFLHTSAYVPMVAEDTVVFHIYTSNDHLGSYEFEAQANMNYMLLLTDSVPDSAKEEDFLKYLLVENTRMQAANPNNVDLVFVNAFPEATFLEFWHAEAGVMIAQVPEGMHSNYVSVPANDFTIDLRQQDTEFVSFHVPLNSIGYHGKAIGLIASDLQQQTDNKNDGQPGLWVALPDAGALHPLDISQTNNAVFSENKTSVFMYPNPSRGRLSVKSEIQIDLMTIYDLSGRKVFSFTPDNMDFSVDLSQLHAGAYLVKFLSSEIIVFDRLIITH